MAGEKQKKTEKLGSGKPPKQTPGQKKQKKNIFQTKKTFFCVFFCPGVGLGGFPDPVFFLFFLPGRKKKQKKRFSDRKKKKFFFFFFCCAFCRFDVKLSVLQ